MESGDPTVHARLDRRGVLRAGVVAFATIAVNGCASLFTTKRDPDVTVAAAGGVVRVPVSAAPWATNGGAGSLVVAVEGRDDKLLVFRAPDGALVAVDMTCTHRGCDVNWDASGGKLVCPCHGSEFAPGGAVTKGPAKRALAAHPVAVEDDAIVVRIA